MEVFTSGATILATIVLGLSAGAVLAEGCVLVPFWRSLQASAFLAWYRQYDGLLFRFFGSLQIAAACIAIGAAALNWLSPVASTAFLVCAAVLALAVLGTFSLYFEKANASFAAGTIAPDRVPQELDRWAQWHWARTVLAVGAFTIALVALMIGGSETVG